MLKWILISILIVVSVFAGCIRERHEPLEKQIILTQDAPQPVGPYSQAVLVGNTLYCAGQIAINPKTGVMVTESIEAETRQVLDNLGAVLNAAGFPARAAVQVARLPKDVNVEIMVTAVK